MSIKGFDNVAKFVMGVVHLELRVGPKTLLTPIQVIDEKLSYNLLLGRPWIHVMRVVTSTLHRCLKFERDGQVHKIEVDRKPFNYCNMIYFSSIGISHVETN